MLDHYPDGVPGLPVEDFGKIFVRCDCSKIVARHFFEYHVCNAPFIDLTCDDEAVIDLTVDE